MQCENMNKYGLSMNKKLYFLDGFLFICNMKLILLPLLLVPLLLCSSCISEYEERLEKARELMNEIEEVKSNQNELGYSCEPEIKELQAQIDFHARVSGNESLFYKELYTNN